MSAIYGNIYHQYTPNVSIYSIHGSYGFYIEVLDLLVLSGSGSHRAAEVAWDMFWACCGLLKMLKFLRL
jgi:hypothetical protein